LNEIGEVFHAGRTLPKPESPGHSGQKCGAKRDARVEAPQRSKGLSWIIALPLVMVLPLGEEIG
jgi:hypothetical protein